MNSSRILIHGLAAIVMVLVATWYFHGHWGDVTRMQLVNRAMVGALAIVFFLRITLRGMLNWFFLRALHANIDWREILCLQYAGLMMNSLLPMPIGIGYRAAYLRGVHRVGLSLFTSMVTAIFVYSLMMSAAAGLLAMLWIGSTGGTVHFAAAAVLGCVFACCALIFVLPHSLPGETWWIVRLNRVLAGWKTITRSRRLIVAATLVVVTTALLGATGLYFAFRAFGVPFGAPGALLLLSSQHIGGLIKLTPGAVGFQETVSAYFATMLEKTMIETVVVLGAARVVQIAVSLVAGIPSLWYLSRNVHPTNEP